VALSPRSVTAAGLATLAAAYAWFATGLYPFTWPALAGTVTGGVAVVALVRLRGTPVRALGPPGARGCPPRQQPPCPKAGAFVWALLVVALGAWELAAFLQHPRPDHPTLSSLANGVFDSHTTRAVAFLAWLGAGAGLARR
jgi:hypothetical protein